LRREKHIATSTHTVPPDIFVPDGRDRHLPEPTARLPMTNVGNQHDSSENIATKGVAGSMRQKSGKELSEQKFIS